MDTTKENGMTNQHPADCALCALNLSGTHVYVDPATQARRVEAARATNERIRSAKR